MSSANKITYLTPLSQDSEIQYHKAEISYHLHQVSVCLKEAESHLQKFHYHVSLVKEAIKQTCFGGVQC